MLFRCRRREILNFESESSHLISSLLLALPSLLCPFSPPYSSSISSPSSPSISPSPLSYFSVFSSIPSSLHFVFTLLSDIFHLSHQTQNPFSTHFTSRCLHILNYFSPIQITFSNKSRYGIYSDIKTLLKTIMKHFTAYRNLILLDILRCFSWRSKIFFLYIFNNS
jgi:hypothetical protein